MPIKEDRIKALGQFLSYQPGEKLDAEQSILVEKAKAALLAIPGHAEYFGAEIRRLTDEKLAGTLKEHSSTRHWHFQTLEHLPSPETVRVLGDLLEDTSDLRPKEPDTDYSVTNNWVEAVGTLDRLGLRGAPKLLPGQKGEDHREAWKAWIRQARFGARKISFEGDPREYRLVEKPGGPPPEPRHRPRPGPVPPDETSPGSPPIPIPWIAALVLALSVVGAVVWWRFQRHRTGG